MLAPPPRLNKPEFAALPTQGDILTAYRTLRSHVEALQQQWQEVDLLQELDRFETEYLEEQTAKEVGVHL